MASQAFFYNAIFFTYALVLTKFDNVSVHDVGWYILPFALANVLGPLILGPLFDFVGRKTMIAFTYAISGVLLAISGWLFVHDQLSATEQTIAWALIFFFASPAAGSAYLTVSEVFPVRILRACHRRFLCAWDGDRRRGRPRSAWEPDRNRRARERLPRLPSWRGLDGLCRCCPGDLGRRRRAKAFGGGRPAIVVGGGMRLHTRFVGPSRHSDAKPS